MGLLDAIFPQQDGGFLDFLKRNANAAVANSPGGLPSDIAQYGNQPPMTRPVGYQPGQVQSAPLQPAPNPVLAPPPQMPPQMPAAQTAAPTPMQFGGTPPALPAMSLGNPLSGFFNRAADGLQSISRGGSLTGAIRGQFDDPQTQHAQVANKTAQALISRGVPQDVAIAAVQPGNTDLLKTVINQAFTQGIHTQEKDQDGNIWDVNKQTGQRTLSLAAKDDKFQNVTVKNPDGTETLRPFNAKTGEYGAPIATVPGASGQPVPKVLGKGGELYHIDKDGKVVVDHKNVDASDASLSDDSTKTMAAQYLAGDRTVLQNLGRGAQGAANIVKLREEITRQANARGLDGAAVAQRMIDYVGDTARERTAATQEGRMAPAGFEAAGAIDLARKASAAVPRGNWVPINRAIQFYEKNSGDPAIRAFGSANTTLINTYARAINPNGVGTVADKEHAREMLSTADSPAAYEAVLQQLDKEIQMAHNSPSQARQQFAKERAVRLGGSAPANSFNDRFGTLDQFSGPALQLGASTVINGVTIKRVN